MNPPLLPQDISHLKTLSTCHYVMAGLYGVGTFFVILHAALMGAAITFDQGSSKDEIPAGFLSFVGLIYGVVILFGLALLVINILSARNMTARKKKTFSMVTAGLNCIGGVPGIVLAIFTFIVLGRASVSAAYAQAECEVLSL